MKTIIHRNATRGHEDHGWLDTHHTFSFANYHNPERVHFGALRVLNDDIVSPAMGFGAHPHDNMEIISIPLVGDLEHKDSTGNGSIIRRNDVQIMSAGTGIFHSERNPSADQEVNFLQIWIFPKLKDIAPRYGQRTYSPEDRKNKLQLVVAPEDKSEETLYINQDAWLSLGSLDAGKELNYSLHRQTNGVYAFLIAGETSINGETLHSRDGAAFSETDELTIQAVEDAEILLIEVPLK
ncbi:MAG: pirin family protein [Spirochaetia bacterium]|nr:pirin family protein [Spirochaetia bacterium]